MDPTADPARSDPNDPAGNAAGWQSPRSWQGTVVRRRNYASVLRTVLARGPISRVDVAREVGLTATAIGSITTPLIAAGLLREVPQTSLTRRRGRPKIPVAINPEGLTVVGVHFGAARTTVGLVDLSGRVVAERVSVHTSDVPGTLVRQAVNAGRRLMANLNRHGPLVGVGASIGGWVDAERGFVVDHPRLHWQGVQLRDILEDALGLPVICNNNARAMALSEAWLGTASLARNFVYVTIGAMAGCAIIIDGRIYNGSRSPAGYIEHLPIGVRGKVRCRCGRYDCLQAATSDDTLLMLARQSTTTSDVKSIPELAELARRGEAVAHRLLRTRARRVGYAVGLLADLLSPELIVLGGSVAETTDYLDELRAAAASSASATPDVKDLIRPTALGDHSLALASGALMLDAIYRDPLSFPPLSTTVTEPAALEASVARRDRGHAIGRIPATGS